MKLSWGGDSIKLVVTNSGITYTDFHNQSDTIAWDEIREVWWEPDAPEHGFSNWIIFGNKRSIEIGERSSDKENLPRWFSEKLTGFDRNVVKTARKKGCFETDEYRTLVCWKKETGNI